MVVYIVEGVDRQIDSWVEAQLNVSLKLDLTKLVIHVHKHGVDFWQDECKLDFQNINVAYIRSWRHKSILVSAIANYLRLVLGIKIVNSNLDADFRANKLRQLLLFRHFNIPTPETIFYGNNSTVKIGRYLNCLPILQISQNKFVLKQLDSRQSKGNLLSSLFKLDHEQKYFSEFMDKPLLIQQYIPELKDYRAIFVGSHPKLLLQRQRENRGGQEFAKLTNTNEIELSNIPHELLNSLSKYLETERLDFAAVDLVDFNNDWYVYEINSQPGLQRSEVVDLLRDYLDTF